MCYISGAINLQPHFFEKQSFMGKKVMFWDFIDRWQIYKIVAV